jgi:hypothetical protein
MHLRFPPVLAGLASLAMTLTLTGCATGMSSSLPREELVRIPSTTGSMLERWVPKSEVSDPTIAPEATFTSMTLRRLRPTGSFRGL